MRLGTLLRIKRHKRRSPDYVADWHLALKIKRDAPETVATVSGWAHAVRLGRKYTRLRRMYYYRQEVSQ